MERLAKGIYDVGWKHLDNELIASIHSVPSNWTSVMRRMAMACDYIRWEAQGDILAGDDESYEEDDDVEPDDEDESRID